MDVASFLSSPIIPAVTAILGVAVCVLSAYKIYMADYRYCTLAAFGAWMLVEFACYAITNTSINGDAFGGTWFAGMTISYGYLYSCSAVMAMIYCIGKARLFHKSTVVIFLTITLISVPYWCFSYYMQANAESWGAEFYLNNGVLLDGAYFAIITGLEAWMAWLGIKCALSPSTGSEPSIRA